MAPTQTPPPTPSAASSTTPHATKRTHKQRRPPQQETAPEEPPSPATLGRSDGLAPSPQGTHPTSAPNTKSAAPGGAMTAGRAIEDARIVPEQRASSKKGGKPATSTVSAVPGKHVQLTGLVISGELGPSGRHGRVEGVEGLAGLLPGPPNSQLPGNGGLANSAGVRPESAPKVLDSMPVRNPSSISAFDVHQKVGQWRSNNPASTPLPPPELAAQLHHY